MAVRGNGFESPLDPHQVASWIAFGLFVLFYAVFYAPVHTDIVGICCTALYAVLFGAVVYTDIMVVRTDPSDPGALAKRKADLAKTTHPAPTDTSKYHFCYLCEAHVNKRSKHCRRCNKCVDVFDHHCPWLNTCVGAVNYKYFLSLLMSTISLTSVQIGTGLQVILRLASDRDAELADLHKVYAGMNDVAYLVLHIFFLVLVSIAWLGIMQLFTFHLGLIAKSITTYEFIIGQRNKQKARDAERGADYVLTCHDHCEGWVSRNAPCLAVCDLCEKTPAAPPMVAAAATKAKLQKVPSGRSRNRPGRATSTRGAYGARALEVQAEAAKAQADAAARAAAPATAPAAPEDAVKAAAEEAAVGEAEQPAGSAPAQRSIEPVETFDDDEEEDGAAALPGYQQALPSPLEKPPLVTDEITIDTREPDADANGVGGLPRGAPPPDAPPPDAPGNAPDEHHGSPAPRKLSHQDSLQMSDHL